MPITTDALKVGLEAGVKTYNFKTLGWGPNLTDEVIVNRLAIAAFDNENFYTVPGGNPHHSSDISTPDVLPYNIAFNDVKVVSSTKVKRSLNEPVVLSIDKTTTIKAIAFALCIHNHNDCQINHFNPTAKTWGNNDYNYSIDADIPPKFTGTTPPKEDDSFQDLFMVIPVNIPVTERGFLTIKGGNENFTYITLESTT